MPCLNNGWFSTSKSISLRTSSESGVSLTFYPYFFLNSSKLVLSNSRLSSSSSFISFNGDGVFSSVCWILRGDGDADFKDFLGSIGSFIRSLEDFLFFLLEGSSSSESDSSSPSRTVSMKKRPPLLGPFFCALAIAS